MEELVANIGLYNIVLAFAITTILYFSSLIVVLSSHKTTMQEKVIWTAVIVLLPLVGLIVYWLVQAIELMKKRT